MLTITTTGHYYKKLKSIPMWHDGVRERTWLLVCCRRRAGRIRNVLGTIRTDRVTVGVARAIVDDLEGEECSDLGRFFVSNVTK